MRAKIHVGERICWPIELWPESDVNSWALACAPQSIFEDDGGALASIAATSQTKYAQGWGRWLAFLANHDAPALRLTPAERCTQERLQAYIDYLRGAAVSDGGIVNRLNELAAAAAAMDRTFNPRMLNRYVAMLRRKSAPIRSKAHIRPANELVDLGFGLLAQASNPNNLDDVIAFRDGLIIAFLALHPIRMRNLVGFALGKNLVHQCDGFMVTLAGNETKNGAPYEIPLAEVLVKPMRAYLGIWRPILANRKGRWMREIGEAVWVSVDGSPMSRESLSGRIELMTREAFGTAINPHAFRDAAATTLAVADPAHVRAAAPLLGHRSLATTEKHYIQATGLQAQRSYLQTIREARRGR